LSIFSGIGPSVAGQLEYYQSNKKKERAMSENKQSHKDKKEGFWKKMVDKLDKKLKEKSQNSCCCCSPKNKDEGPTCCS
jgi:hypothetical protein